MVELYVFIVQLTKLNWLYTNWRIFSLQHYSPIYYPNPLADLLTISSNVTNKLRCLHNSNFYMEWRKEQRDSDRRGREGGGAQRLDLRVKEPTKTVRTWRGQNTLL